MRLLSARTFRIEAGVIALACISVVALALLLVQDAVTRTESTLKSAAIQEVAGASAELKQQYEERAAFSQNPLDSLPPDAQDLSLRGLSQAVLRSYKDVQGGFYVPATATLIGVAGPSAEQDDETLGAIRTAAAQSTATIESGGDLLVAGAARTSDGRYAWALKRLVAVRDSAPSRRRWGLATLVLAALAGVAGVASISIRLRRGVGRIKHTLQQLESDFAYRPPAASDDFGEIHAAIGKMADRRLELETSLRRQDRLAALGKVVAGVAHEIRNPLNSIRLQLELLKRRTQRGVASAGEIDEAMAQVDRLNAILGQLLGFGKPEFNSRSEQDIVPLAARSIDLVRSRALENNVDVRMASNGAALPAVVDALQIEQVLTNLLLNAIEASPPNTKVDVDCALRGESVEIRVSDQGSGIPDAAKEHIFDAFFTTRAEGTGLGLSVSREIVTRHGGSLEFTSSPGATTFIVRLPAGRKD